MKEYEIPGHLFPTRAGNWHVIDGKLWDLDADEVPPSVPSAPSRNVLEEDESGGESAHDKPQ